jgi:ribonucleoside-diphosphate reductase subunit M2
MQSSPAKKLVFDPRDKENMSHDVVLPLVDDFDFKKPSVELVKTEAKKLVVAPGIKSFEADEPLLQENPHRFVLFPIKYHEVCCFRRVTRILIF